MLVLTRRLGESIVINGNIRLSVQDVKGDRVRLGVEAPRDIPVDRKEVHERRKQFSEPIEAPAYFCGPRHSRNGHGARGSLVE